MKMFPVFLFIISLTVLSHALHSQALMETGGKKMPDEWIDSSTHHKVIRLTRLEGRNSSFYFHNYPFVGNKMVFYNTDKEGKQVYTVDLNSLATEKITSQSSPMGGEIVGRKKGNVYYQVKDSVFSTNINSKKTKRSL